MPLRLLLELPAESGRRRQVTLELVTHATARRVIMRVPDADRVRLTVPVGFAIAEAVRFAHLNADWISKQIEKMRTVARAQRWGDAKEILLRGKPTLVEVETKAGAMTIALDGHLFSCPSNPQNIRPAVIAHLMQLARAELPSRTYELAGMHAIAIKRVTIRNQRRRWGSCSSTRAISLNWRLIQVPDAVRDYVILHELTHCDEMNHSPRFWHLLAQRCPHLDDSEHWLRQRERELLAF